MTRAHRGASAIEILVCLLALLVGLWAGAAYLGLDLQVAWQFCMAKVGIASPPKQSALAGELPPSAESGQGESLGAPAGAPEPAVVPHEAQDEGTLPAKTDDQGAEPAQPVPSVGERTLGYWRELGEIILRAQHEEQVRAAGSLREVLSARGKSCRAAVQGIRSLKTEGVDPEVVQLAQDFARWYERGAEISEEGAYLLDEGELSDAQGPVGRRWHSAQKQHREELDLLNRKSNSQRSKLATRYQLSFPGLL
jgi:hypothetical protein